MHVTGAKPGARFSGLPALSRKAICLCLCLPAVWLPAVKAGFASQSFSESGVGRAAQISPGGTTLSAAGSSDLERGFARDVISGNGSRGPFRLSWKGIVPGRETVLIDGRPGLRGVDYNLDPASGTIAFTSPLGASSMAKVEYGLDPATSVRSGSGFALPLALNLYSSGSSSLQMSALYRQSATDPNAADAILGFQGKTQLGANTSFASSVYMDQGGAANSGSLWQRAAARFGGTTQIGDLSITGSYVSAGQAFSAAKDYGFKGGEGQQNLALAWKPEGSRLSLGSSYDRRDFSGGAKTVTTLNNTLGYNVAPGTAFLFTRTATATQTGSGVTDVQVNEFKLASAIGQKTSTQFVWTDTLQGPQDALSRTTTQQVTLNTSLLKDVAVNAGMKLTDSEATGSASALNVGLSAAPLKDVALTAAFQANTVQSGEDTTAVDIGVKARPLKVVELQANFAGRGSDLGGADNSAGLRVATAASDRWKLSAGITDRQASAGFRTHDIRLDAQPYKTLKLSGGYAFSDSDDNTLAVKDINASAKPLDYFNIAGGYKTRDAGDYSIDTTMLSFTLEPWKYLGLTAALADNPEDSKGNPQQYSSRSLGLKSTFGILALTGDYSYKDEYAIGRQWFQTRLGLGVAVARATQLTGGYEYSETQESAGVSSRRISLGVTRNLGSDFNLSLSGSRIDDEAAAEQRRRYEAEMKLGMKF
ncbi:MAG: hypothetical protein IT209_06105 [Armatimonadetes bacterium]|nr:hypothetical protein [Armatimonadota bacterium]